MKRRVAIVLSLCTLMTVAYFTASKWLIRHQTVTFFDILRSERPDSVKTSIQTMVQKFLDEDDSLSPGETTPVNPTNPFGLVTASAPR